MKRWAVLWACLSVVPISFDSPSRAVPVDADRVARGGVAAARSSSVADPLQAPPRSAGSREPTALR